MTGATPYAPYGLGLEIADIGPACGGVYFGHGGGLHEYLSLLLSTPDRGTRLEISITTGDADYKDPAVANKFSEAFDNALIAALCDRPPGGSARVPPGARNMELNIF